jgi:hypothetical protein
MFTENQVRHFYVAKNVEDLNTPITLANDNGDISMR